MGDPLVVARAEETEIVWRTLRFAPPREGCAELIFGGIMIAFGPDGRAGMACCSLEDSWNEERGVGEALTRLEIARRLEPWRDSGKFVLVRPAPHQPTLRGWVRDATRYACVCASLWGFGPRVDIWTSREGLEELQLRVASQLDRLKHQAAARRYDSRRARQRVDDLERILADMTIHPVEKG